MVCVFLIAMVGVLNAETITVTNTNFSGPGSLGQAIIDANADPAESSIVFDIAGDETHDILTGHHTGNLPEIVTPVTFYGNNTAGPVVLVGGAPTGPGAPVDGLCFGAGSEGSKVYNTNTRGFLSAILIRGASNITIVNNNFTDAFARSVKIENGSGILIERNTISDNDALSIQMSDANNVAIFGNTILSGNIIISNSSYIYVGNTSYGGRNIIQNSCQGAEAAIIVTGACSNIQVLNNMITDQTGGGLAIYGVKNNNHIVAKNIFTNNKGWDIVATGKDMSFYQNQIFGDPIAIEAGMSLTGCESVTITSNVFSGARLTMLGTTKTTIGGMGIEGNTFTKDPVGVSAYGAIIMTDSSQNTILNNAIVENASHGINLINSYANTIKLNRIYKNGRTAVRIQSGYSNRISMNIMYEQHASSGNGNDSIMLLGDSNNGKQPPVITSIVKNGDLLEISGTTSGSDDIIEVFESDEESLHQTLRHNTRKYLRTVYAVDYTWTVTVGAAEFSGTEAFITATATDADSNTSELALVESVVLNDGIAGPTTIITNTPYTYSVTDIPGTQFTWWVGGDAVIENNNNNVVTITFSEWFVSGLVNVGYMDPVDGWVVKSLEVTAH